MISILLHRPHTIHTTPRYTHFTLHTNTTHHALHSTRHYTHCTRHTLHTPPQDTLHTTHNYTQRHSTHTTHPTQQFTPTPPHLHCQVCGGIYRAAPSPPPPPSQRWTHRSNARTETKPRAAPFSIRRQMMSGKGCSVDVRPQNV